MAHFESEGYCPNNTVWEYINSDKCTNKNLSGLWSIIGARVVCVSEPEDVGNVWWPRVTEIFTSDPMSAKVMAEIIKFNANAEKIAVHNLEHYSKDPCDLVQERLAQMPKSKLVLYPASNYAAILNAADYGIDVYVCLLSVHW